MSILSGFKRFKDYILTENGYQLTSRWTSSDSVIMGDGTDDTNTLEENINSIEDRLANHTHSYAGSSSSGGSATSAVKLDTSSAGSATQPTYFSDGKPVACTYSLNKTVPSNAVFTDTTYNGSSLKTSVAKTGSAGSSITTSIAANTSMDSAIGTLLNNDATLNSNLSNKQDKISTGYKFKRVSKTLSAITTSSETIGSITRYYAEISVSDFGASDLTSASQIVNVANSYFGGASEVVPIGFTYSSTSKVRLYFLNSFSQKNFSIIVHYEVSF